MLVIFNEYYWCIALYSEKDIFATEILGDLKTALTRKYYREPIKAG